MSENLSNKNCGLLGFINFVDGQAEELQAFPMEHVRVRICEIHKLSDVLKRQARDVVIRQDALLQFLQIQRLKFRQQL